MSPHLIDFIRGKQHQPLVILLGGVHGNEPAGLHAIRQVLGQLSAENCQGSTLGLRGNIAAININERFIVSDLNRLWDEETLTKVTTTPFEELTADEQSLIGLKDVIQEYVGTINPSAIYFLDLHTTSSDGGIFSILTNDQRSIEIGQELGIPCVFDLLKNVENSVLHYIQKQDWGTPTTVLACECGHHKDPFSVYRAFAICMRFLVLSGVVDQEVARNDYDHILNVYAEKLPKRTNVKYRYGIDDARFFMMKPGYSHYSQVRQGETVARYDGKHIIAPMDGMLLMPLYQKQGSDGFFIVSEC